MAEPVSANLLRALSHPVRLAMLIELERGELTARELAERVGVPPADGDAHLDALRAAGLVLKGERPGHVRTSADGWAAIDRELRRLQGPDGGGPAAGRRRR
jgi:DNA-binding transcriptional ArsR family regulator